MRHRNSLKAAWLETPLGPMIAISDEYALYFLQFMDPEHSTVKLQKISQKLKALITLGDTAIIRQISAEITQYFQGDLSGFTTSLHFIGSPFQKKVWETLREIPVGVTRSYLEVAKILKKPTAARAVARANATNPLVLIVPCHRVINANGTLGGYNSGLDRKQWLLVHEKRQALNSNR